MGGKRTIFLERRGSLAASGKSGEVEVYDAGVWVVGDGKGASCVAEKKSASLSTAKGDPGE